MKELVLHLFPFAGDEDIQNILAWVKNGDPVNNGVWKEGEEEAEYRDLFKSYDRNGDKKLTVKEVR